MKFTCSAPKEIMEHKIYLLVWISIASILTLNLSGPVEGAEGEWKFVVMGDTRDRVTNTGTGISPDLAANRNS
jgi:hypothetical protein